MPNMIDHIDSIGRAKGRDVLFVTFHNGVRDRLDWENSPVRQRIIAWLDERGVAWCCCGDIASTTVFDRYLGQIYIDVPFDLNAAAYQTLSQFLEKPDGTTALEGARFCYLPLAMALKNAAHDEPGFWGKLAQDF